MSSVSSSSATALSTQNAKGVSTGTSYGRNATVTVNGSAVQSDGLNVNVVTANLEGTFTLNASTNTVGASKTFGVTGGGATFSLGAQVNTANTGSIGIGNINTGSIGKYVSNGTIYSLSDLGSGKAAAVNAGDTGLAQNIVNQAIKDVSNLRGRLGAFQQNVLGSTIDSLNTALENVSSSLSTDSGHGFRDGDQQPDAEPDPGAGGHERAVDGQRGPAERAETAGIRSVARDGGRHEVRPSRGAIPGVPAGECGAGRAKRVARGHSASVRRATFMGTRRGPRSVTDAVPGPPWARTGPGEMTWRRREGAKTTAARRCDRPIPELGFRCG